MANGETATVRTTATEGAAAHTLRLTRVFDAPRERVYGAWTLPAHIAAWWGPEGHTCDDYSFDVRAGGKWRSNMRGPEGQDHIASGEFVEIVENERVVMTWAWETDGVRGHDTLVTVELRDEGDGTELTLIHEKFETAEARDNHGMGWTSSLGCLEAWLAGS